jgi:hypothetical protein
VGKLAFLRAVDIMNRLPPLIVALGLVLVVTTGHAQKQKQEFLTDEEQDKLREAQDPSQRIEVYLALAQARLERFQDFRKKPADPRYNNGAFLDSLLDQYVALHDELKNWIDDQFERQGDMRRGLRSLLERGAKQMEELRRIHESPDPFASEYGNTLRDAIEDLSDTLDGATKALVSQEKQFREMKREEKTDARSAKERRKEEEKRTKEENKLRKRQRKHGANPEPDEN